MEGTFVYTNTDGTTYSNTINGGGSIGFPAGFDTINKSSAQTLTWVGDPLATDEHVGVFVGFLDLGAGCLIFSRSRWSYRHCDGKLNQMANLALGTSTVYMDRAKASDVDEGTQEGGRMRYKYRCTNAQIEVIE